MFLILRLFNSILFVIANLAIALYTLQRFFRTMKLHYNLVEEVEEFSSLVDQSRASLDYVGTKLMEAMKEMETDIGKEVYVTHNLTKLSSKIASISRRFNALEEGIIERARMSNNFENATVETPADINQEVRRILHAKKRNKSPSAEDGEQQHSRPRTPRKKSRQSRSHGAMESVISQQQAPVSTSASKLPQTPQQQQPTKKRMSRSRSPKLVPQVMLLDDKTSLGAAVVDKPIGFRPPWMCPV